MSPWIPAGVAMLAVLMALLVLYFFRAFQVPRPSSMPAVVDEPMEALLQSLKDELNLQHPERVSSLQPGIGDEELRQAENDLGRSIHPEMQALYRWHNGLANDLELFPGHTFWPLEQAIRTNRELNEQYREKGFGLLMAHEENWLILFPDSAGDGYYYDPSQEYQSGGVFYNFREAGYYRYFPSIKNLLKAVVECYQQGAYRKNGDTDFDLEDKILNKYGAAVEQE